MEMNTSICGVISGTRHLLSPQCVFLIWCMAPVTWNGSEILYKRAIRPFFLKHQASMENVVNDLSAKAKSVTETITKEGEIPTVVMQVQPHLFTLLTAAAVLSQQTSMSMTSQIWHVNIFSQIPYTVFFVFLSAREIFISHLFLSSAVNRALNHDKDQ